MSPNKKSAGSLIQKFTDVRVRNWPLRKKNPSNRVIEFPVSVSASGDTEVIERVDRLKDFNGKNDFWIHSLDVKRSSFAGWELDWSCVCASVQNQVGKSFSKTVWIRHSIAHEHLMCRRWQSKRKHIHSPTAFQIHWESDDNEAAAAGWKLSPPGGWKLKSFPVSWTWWSHIHLLKTYESSFYISRFSGLL